MALHFTIEIPLIVARDTTQSRSHLQRQGGWAFPSIQIVPVQHIALDICWHDHNRILPSSPRSRADAPPANRAGEHTTE